MRHGRKNKKFGREIDQRRALFRSLASNLIRDEKIKTTEAKAKALRPFIEKLVTKAKSGALSDRRIVASRIGAPAAKKLFDKIAPAHKSRKGGYTRITKLPIRKSDASKMALIEFV